MLQLPVRLSAETFAVTWRYADVGELPAPLYLPTPGGQTGDGYDTAHAEIAAFTELRELAGDDRRGFTADLEGIYQQLAQAREEYSAWMLGGDGVGRTAMLACHGPRAVLAELDEHSVLLSVARPSADSLTAALPQWPAAEFRPASARTDELFDSPVESLSPEVAVLREVFATRPTGKGQCYVSVRAAGERRYTTPVPVNYIDPEPGRVLFYTSDNGGGEYVTAKPGTPRTIAEELARARDALFDPAQIPGQPGRTDQPADH